MRLLTYLLVEIFTFVNFEIKDLSSNIKYIVYVYSV